MLEPRKSLASYFDDPSSATWHEMTESGGGLEAYHDGADGKQYFHPDDQQPNAIPAGMHYHRKGTTWKPDQWGYNAEIAEKNKAKRAEAAQVREKHSKDVKDIHATTMAIFLRRNAQVFLFTLQRRPENVERGSFRSQFRGAFLPRSQIVICFSTNFYLISMASHHNHFQLLSPFLKKFF